MPNPKLETYKNKATGIIYDYTDKNAQASLTAILDGTNIDSFGDVETELNTINGKIPDGASTSNKLVTTILLENSLTDKVDKTSIGANNGVAGLDNTGRVPSSQLPSYVDDVLEYASISAFPATGESGKIYIAQDTNLQYRWSGTQYAEISESLALGETSSTAYAGNKGKANADAITAMKNGSNIDSFGDVETALDDKVDKVAGKGLSTNDYNATAKGIVDNIQSNVIANTKLIKDTVGWSGKNLLENNLVSQVYHSTTITVNSDKSVSFANTPNNDLWMTINSDIRLSAGRYKLSGCPANGGSTKYFLRFVVRNADDTANEETYFDYGSGVEFEITSTTAGRKCNVFIYVKSGQATEFTFYPMLLDSKILDPTYEPYFGSTAFPRSEQAVLGAKNLLPNTASTQTVNGITFTVNSDGTVTANGTASETAFLPIVSPNTFNLKADSYILSAGGDIDGNYNKYGMYVHEGSADIATTADDAHSRFTLAADTVLDSIRIFVMSGQTVNNIVFKPMIRLATDTDSTYVPYAMTNRELTEVVITKDVTVTAGTDVTVNANTHVYSKAGVVTGSLRLEIGATLTAGATIATLSAIPKNTTYAIGIDNTDKSVIPIILGNNGAVQLFGGFIPTSGNQLLIPIAYATA